jgi:serine/threonine-protein kinase
MDGMLTGPEGLIGSIIGGVQLTRVLRLTTTGALFAGHMAGAPDELRTVALTIMAWQATPAARAANGAAFLRAAQAAAQVRHPNLAPIERFGDEGGLLSIIMPAFPGGSLADRLAQGPLALDQAAALVGQIGGALDALHAGGIIHGNVTPEAILTDGSGTWYLSDLRLVPAPAAPSMDMAAYQAPEALRGEPLGPAADTFGLGVVLYRAITGALPFQGATYADLVMRQMMTIPPPPRFARPDLPPAAEAALLHALAKPAEARPPSGTAFAQEFAAALAGAAFTPSLMQPQATEQAGPITPQAPLYPTAPATGQPLSGPPPFYGAPFSGAPPQAPMPGTQTPGYVIVPGNAATPPTAPHVPGIPPYTMPYPSDAPAALYGRAPSPPTGPYGADGRPLMAPPPPARSVPTRAILSIGLAVVVIVASFGTILFINRGHLGGNAGGPGHGTPSATATPSPIIGGYDTSYTYHTPTQTGGSIIIGDTNASAGANIFFAAYSYASQDLANAGWATCVIQLPDTRLGDASWRPDQCTQVPTLANGDESADGTTTTIHIDPQAQWSDGQPITSADYLFMIHLLRDPNVGYITNPVWQNAQVSAPDTHTVVFQWEQPYGIYLQAIASLAIAEPVHLFPGVYSASSGTYSSSAAQKLLSNATFLYPHVSDGPFVIQSADAQGNSVVMMRNPHYTSHFFHQPVLTQLQFVNNASLSTLQQSFQSGQDALVDNVYQEDLAQIGGVGTSQIILSPSFTPEIETFNVRSVAPNARAGGAASLFASATVRKAFAEGADRCVVFQSVLNTTCTNPAYVTNEVVTPLDPANDAQVQIPYNPTDAAHLLDAAGYTLDSQGQRTYPNGKPISLTFATTQISHQVAEARVLQQQWQQNLHITVTVQSIASGTLFNGFTYGGTLTTGAFDISLFAIGSTGDDDDWTYSLAKSQIPSTSLPFGGNVTGIDDPTIEQDFTQGASTVDATARTAIYKQLFTYVSDQAYYVPLYMRPNIALMNGTIGNYKQNSVNYTENMWNVADWFLTTG